MRGTLVRIAISSSLTVAGGGVFAALATGQVGPAAMGTFRLLMWAATVIILGGAALAWSASPGPRVWNMAGNIPVSSGTRYMWDTGQFAASELSPGTLPVALGTALVLLVLSIGLSLVG